MFKKIALLCSIVFIASGCSMSLVFHKKYEWEKVRKPKRSIEWRVVTQEEINQVCKNIAEFNPTACTDSRKEICVIYARKSVIDEHPEVVRHELAHCLGYSHPNQI